MSEIEITIKIPAPPDGWVYDGHRKAKPGEMYWVNNRWAVREPVETETSYCYPVAVKVPPPWEPPQSMVDAILLVLGPGWLVETQGSWLFRLSRPTFEQVRIGGTVSNTWLLGKSGGVMWLPNLREIKVPDSVALSDRCWKIGDPQQ